jgi:ribosomal protein S18 acetylase RimI-like enzyme
MPEIEIRPALATDIGYLVSIEHSYKSNYVWQMDINAEDGQVMVNFREVRLPRAVRVEYPRDFQSLAQDWMRRSAVLAAVLDGRPVGYVSLDESISPTTAWVTDLAVQEDMRHKGIATALLLAAQEWAAVRKDRRIILEVQSKNQAAIHLAKKLGYEFCGYNDHYYSNQDIALFFAQFLR